jgi:hypothetical protein
LFCSLSLIFKSKISPSLIISINFFHFLSQRYHSKKLWHQRQNSPISQNSGLRPFHPPKKSNGEWRTEQKKSWKTLIQLKSIRNNFRIYATFKNLFAPFTLFPISFVSCWWHFREIVHNFYAQLFRIKSFFVQSEFFLMCFYCHNICFYCFLEKPLSKDIKMGCNFLVMCCEWGVLVNSLLTLIRLDGMGKFFMNFSVVSNLKFLRKVRWKILIEISWFVVFLSIFRKIMEIPYRKFLRKISNQKQ